MPYFLATCALPGQKGPTRMGHSGQSPEQNGVGAAANDAENGQTHAKGTVGEAHWRLPERCLSPPSHLSVRLLVCVLP